MGGLPARATPHSITRVRPVETTDGYGDTVRDYTEAGGATRTAGIRAWVQQDRRAERYADGRSPNEQEWLLLTNDPDFTTHDQVEWSDDETGIDRTFTVEGDPEPTYTPAGFHHLEATLRIHSG